jgi:hypothetical protein
VGVGVCTLASALVIGTAYEATVHVVRGERGGAALLEVKVQRLSAHSVKVWAFPRSRRLLFSLCFP